MKEYMIKVHTMFRDMTDKAGVTRLDNVLQIVGRARGKDVGV